MKVLVVGGDGYVGTVLRKHLKEKHVVTSYDMLASQDVKDRKLFRGFCKGKDAIIYLAGITNNDECVARPQFAWLNNIGCFEQVLEDAKDIKRFIFASSVAAYGSGEDLMTEDDPLVPQTPYSVAKAYCELVLKESKIPYVITRSASVCGWSPRMRHDLTVNKMVHDALTERIIKVNGGSQFRCHVHIQDLCDFYELLLEAPETKVLGEAFNVVALNATVKETAELVAFIIPKTAVHFGPATDDRSYKASGKKAEEILGFRPKRTIAQAVLDILEHRND